jgi:hypothetical protein
LGNVWRYCHSMLSCVWKMVGGLASGIKSVVLISDLLSVHIYSLKFKSQKIYVFTLWENGMIVLGMGINMNCAAFQFWSNSHQFKITSFFGPFPCADHSNWFSKTIQHFAGNIAVLLIKIVRIFFYLFSSKP